MTTPSTPSPSPSLKEVAREELDLLVAGGHGDPRSVLGAHPH